MATATVESSQKLRTLIPHLAKSYATMPESAELLSLVQEANVLTPVYVSLSEHIRKELPSLQFSSTVSRQDFARSYNDCNAFFEKLQQDVTDFTKLICRHTVNLQVDGQSTPEARIAAMESARKPLMAAVQRLKLPLPQIQDGQLMDPSSELIQTTVNTWIQDSCHAIASQLLMSLHVLVERQVVGIIDWYDDTACKLHFYRHIVTQDQIRTKATQRSSTAVNADTSRTITTEHFEQLKGRNTHSIERHEHRVVDAETREPDQARHLIPHKHKSFLDHIPHWILKYVRILEGNLTYESIGSRTVRVETFQSKPIRTGIHKETLPVVRTPDELDPAILLGHFVLTGWTQREIEQEKRQRDWNASLPVPSSPSDPDRREAGRLHKAVEPFMVAGVIGSGLMMLLSRMQHTMMVPLALLLSFASVALCSYYFRMKSRWQRGSADSIYVAAATARIAFGLLAVQCGIYGVLYGNTSVVGVIFLSAIGTAVTKQIVKSRQPE